MNENIIRTISSEMNRYLNNYQMSKLQEVLYNMQESIPYESAKPMYLVDDVDNQESLRDIVLDTCKDLKK